jgi:multiple sugar transport system permease protein
MAATTTTSVERTTRRNWRRVVVPYLFLAPFVVPFVLFRVLPLAYGFFLSFTNTRLGRADGDFVGLGNYARLLDDSRFQLSLVNTAVYTLEATAPVLGVPLLLAVLLNRDVGLRTLLRSIFFFPNTLSVATLGVIWLWMLDPLAGPLNYYLKQLGASPPSWLGSTSTAMWAVVMTAIWWVTGYYLVIYLAALQDIPRHLYEAAAIDGASGWRSFWSITLPLLRPVFLFVGVIHISGAFQIFGHVVVLTGGGPADATRTIVQHIYETGFKDRFALGSAAAMSWVLFLIILAFSLLQFRFVRGRIDY